MKYIFSTLQLILFDMNHKRNILQVITIKYSKQHR
jgi:hypothetical protein